MMRRQSKAAPLVVLLGFEVAAIVGLQGLGSAQSMQIPWGDLSGWLLNPIDVIAAPILRLVALGLAYWMFVTTALCVIAQVSRVPAAIRATSMLTLPSVRRVVDGAMVMSIATTSMVSMGGTAFAADTSSTDITTSISATSGDLSVPTPTPGATADGSTTSSTSTSTSTAPTTVPSTTAVSPSTGQDWVSTPVPVPAEVTTSTTAPITTSTTVPQGPSTPATSPVENPSVQTPTPAPEPQTQVLAASEHRVSPGENLWTISRDAIADSTGRPASQISESEIRDYWLQVIDANKDTLRSKDPHWIFPGEVVNLPSLDTAAPAGS